MSKYKCSKLDRQHPEHFAAEYKYFYLKDESVNFKYLGHVFSKIENQYKNEYQKEWNINDFIEKVGKLLNIICSTFENGDYEEDELLKNIKILN